MLDRISPYNLRSVHRRNGGREHAAASELPGEYVVWLPHADRRGAHCSRSDGSQLFDVQEVKVAPAQALHQLPLLPLRVLGDSAYQSFHVQRQDVELLPTGYGELRQNPYPRQQAAILQELSSILSGEGTR